jgi:hypothetical protein
MFFSHSANMVCAACVARFPDGSRTLFENLGPTGQEIRHPLARPQTLRIVNRHSNRHCGD